MGDSVVQQWTHNLTLKQQTVLLSALRGCDGKSKEDPSKQLARALRCVVLRNAAEEDDKFMRAHGEFLDRVRDVVEDLDHYPVHWVMHFAHAAEVIGYKYPAELTRGQWHYAYKMFVDALHLRIESESDLDRRLADGVISPIHKYNDDTWGGAGYGHSRSSGYR